MPINKRLSIKEQKSNLPLETIPNVKDDNEEAADLQVGRSESGVDLLESLD